MAKAERHYDLTPETIEEASALINKIVHTPVKIEYSFLGDNKLKKLMKISKYNDQLLHVHKKQVLVTINESAWVLIAQDAQYLELLVREELNGLSVNMDNGKIKVEKHKFNTSKSIIDKYTFEAVSKAKELEEHVLSQLKDKEKDNETIDISA